MADRARQIPIGSVAVMLIVVAGVPFLPLLITGRWTWWQAWFFALFSIVSFAVSRLLAGRRNPGLLVERAQFLRHADAKPWDRLLARLVGLGGGLVPLVAGLDVEYGWSSGVAPAVPWIGLAALVAGHGLGGYALIENRFFSGMVRLQFDRGHQVVTTGPYGWVRHPGYAGAVLAYLGTPLLLGSVWALVPACLFGLVLLVRTALEDRTLQAELPGYSSYAARVRYRWVPGIW